MSQDPASRPPDNLQVLTRVMGLAIACPYSQDNPERCQLCVVRSLPMPERIDWVRSLTAGELLRVSSGHETCLKALEQLSGQGDEDIVQTSD